jgi:hypothetical protein
MEFLSSKDLRKFEEFEEIWGKLGKNEDLDFMTYPIALNSI